MIQFHNTLSGELETFEPLSSQEVGIYTCGPTVYDYAHIGNFRAFIFEDLLRRFLLFKGFKVHHVMNLTDVDDKTIAAAQREGKPLQEYTKKYTDAFLEDLKTLNIFQSDSPPYRLEVPRATEWIHGRNGKKGMVEWIEALIQRGKAYESDGSVYYRISEFPGYGKLSKKKIEGNIAGAGKRVDVDEYDREQISDFVLWKKAKEGEPSWDSPWGKGRPGWHIECSVMSLNTLGEQFDIHAGGEDLIFPHHENEIAQSEGATGKKPFVKYWLHCKHLLVNGEKMSKSKGNFFTLRDLLAKGYDPTAIRYALLSVHYRQQLNFTLDGLKDAAEVIKKFDQCYYQCLSVASIGYENSKHPANKIDFDQNLKLEGVIEKIVKALENDLNTSEAFAALSEGIKEINSWFPMVAMSHTDLTAALYFFELVDELFGLDIAKDKHIPAGITDTLQQIIRFRKEKDFTQADALRKKVNAEGWVVKDARPGEPSTVKRKRRTWD